ncbi:[protein release factor]-glutamine N5-methyltransferase [Desulfuromusa kysingii]|uniref:Release factor glutamine methyltransferase n=1 Tax=Desulfuromusa kysingii TaxID=37625 RepID=A0A1H3XH90_9BACT|nr:peptide chain release factor N(5)-glutamine methyltransferase [Desulfuromusa kysingii]SDZ98311.1 [protein release factor]-glutamine N5-methyltransferase [Desulfuromusa kysingii]
MTQNSLTVPVEQENNDLWTLLRLLRWVTTYFTEKGIDSPRLDAELLLAHTLQLDRVGLYLNYDRPLLAAELDKIRPLVKRRGQREPLQYLLGTTEFWSLEFVVTPAVLIPRADTEILVEEALNHTGPEGQLLDVGTGSGAIVISLASERPTWQMTGLDISSPALAVAQKNVARHQLEKRIELLQGDLAELPQRQYDLIVSNPPYISRQEWDELMPEVRCFEPQLALLADNDGLECYQQLVTQAQTRLNAHGWLLVEIGYQQAEAVKSLFLAAGFKDVFVRKDYSGQPRVVGGCLY